MYTVKKLENNKYEITISATKKEWEEYVEHVYEETKGKYNIEGFRKGKAPRAIIEKNYGESVFFDGAIDHLFSHEYAEAIKNETDIEPISDPEVRIDKFDDNGLVIVAEVQSVPDVKLGKYTGLTVKKATGEVSEEQLNKELDQARERQARYTEVEREARDDDYVVIDFVGSVNGVEFEGGKANDYRLKLGSKTFIPGFEDQIIGMHLGETKDINVVFPEDYQAEDLKGKPAVFAVTLKKVEEKNLPELNDEFASNVSEFETLEDYKNDLKKHMQENLDSRLKRETENNIIDEIVKASEVEIPESMVERQLDMFMEDFSNRLMYQGISLEDYVKYAKTTVEDLRNERKEQSKEVVKTRLVLQAIVKAEKLDVSDEEVDAKIKETAEKYKKTFEEYKTHLGEQNIAYMKNDILMAKLLKFITDNNKAE